MPGSAPTRRLVRFGVFELDAEALELRKHGMKVRLQDQPFKVLQLLLERPGHTVTRDELRARVWPANTFVEFDQGLYSAISRLRDALGDPSERPLFVETVARHGYRFIAPLTESYGTGDGGEQTEAAPPGARDLRRFAVAGLAALSGGVLLLGGLLAFDVGRVREWLRERGAHPIRSLAVLPLLDLSGDPEQNYLAEGVTDELTTELARLGNLRMVSRTSLERYKNTSKPLAQVGRELNVDAVVEGTVERLGSRIRIRVQLIRLPDETHLWAQTYTGELRDTLRLRSEAARDIAGEIHLSLIQRQHGLARPRQVDPEAYEAYLKAMYFSNKRSPRNFERAIELFQQAIARDPGYAMAYSGLSDAFIGQLYLGTPSEKLRAKARWTALKSVELDPSSPEAHNSLASVRELYEWDWAGAESEYQRALELNANFALAHQFYAVFLATQGRFDLALAEAQRAQDLDPASAFVRTTFCLVLIFARRYDGAIDKCGQALELDPHFMHAHGNLVNIYDAVGMHREAVVEYEKAAIIAGEDPAHIAAVKEAFARGGKEGFWRKLLDLTLARPPGTTDPYGVAELYSRIGERDRAIEWLQQAYEKRSARMEELKVGPAFDDLRSDPRYGDLVRRLGL